MPEIAPPTVVLPVQRPAPVNRGRNPEQQHDVESLPWQANVARIGRVMGFELKKREATSLDFCCSAGMTGGDVIWPDSVPIGSPVSVTVKHERPLCIACKKSVPNNKA